jgi:hypothetical protein
MSTRSRTRLPATSRSALDAIFGIEATASDPEVPVGGDNRLGTGCLGRRIVNPQGWGQNKLVRLALTRRRMVTLSIIAVGHETAD